MARKKVKLAYITNNSLRKTSFYKRKKGLLKKMDEISTLCGIDVGAIIYSPYDPTTPEVWPSVDGMRQVIHSFQNLPDRQKIVANHMEFLQQRKEKLDKLLQKQKRENREAYITEVMYQCLAGNMSVADTNSGDLNDLAFVIKQFLDPLDSRIKSLGGSDMEIGESSNAVAAATDPSEPVGTLTLAPATTLHGFGSSSSSAASGASFFNPMHHYPHYYQPQPFYQPRAGLYDQPRNQNQYMGMMNPPENMCYAPHQMGFPYMDYNRQAYHRHYQPQQHQLFPVESSAAPPPATSGSVTPATTLNPTNNTWFNN